MFVSRWTVALLLLSFSHTRGLAQTSRSLDTLTLARAVRDIATRAEPGVLGVAVKDLTSGVEWSWNGAQPFPLQSTFKAPLGAALLAAVDRHEIKLTDTIHITSKDLSPPYSDVGANFPKRSNYTVEELLVAAVGSSDNTAADVLLRRAGGPAAVTQWLVQHGVRGLSLDHYERDFQVQLEGMPPFRPEWAEEEAFRRAMNAVPLERRRRAIINYMQSGKDASTPQGAVAFLEQLQSGRLLSAQSTQQLLQIMTATTTGPQRIKAGLPAGSILAHKTGTGRRDADMYPAVNDIGIITLPSGQRLLLAIFLKGSTMPLDKTEAVHADVTRAMIAALH